MRVLLLWTLLLPWSGFAQSDTSKQALRRPPYTLKITPLDLINPFQQAINVQADIPLTQRWGIDLGIGFVMNSWSFTQYKGESYRGLKLKPILKYYTSRTSSNDGYIGLVLKYTYIQNERYINVLRQGGQYTEWLLESKKIVIRGAGVRYGLQYYFGKRKRGVMEPFVGIGIRNVQVSTYDLPPDAELFLTEDWFSVDRPAGSYTTPDLMLGFSAGWVLSTDH
ncbi:MAG: DUF3575 domain-containing protein [Saprospiraceae bacterium]|nr:DUF3575 domain-containing protein [Saprospiraceae bacterium]